MLAASFFKRSGRPRYSALAPSNIDGRGASIAALFRKKPYLVVVPLACIVLFGIALFGHSSTHNYVPNIPLRILSPTEHDAAQKHLVIASFTAQNVDWMSQVPSSWQIKRYMMDEPNPEPPNLAVPRNQGREAMAYLTYIVDNYDTLPEYMIFTHGHERSWHQVESLPVKIRALNLTALDVENYISLRCGDQMGCEKHPYIDTLHPNWGGENNMCAFWDTIVPTEPCPRYVSYKCCAQHAVTRAAIRFRSKRDWLRIREPLLHNATDYPTWGRGADTWQQGMFYEKFWHVLHGAGAEYCPSVETCQQTHFSNAIACDGDIDTTPFESDAWKETVCVSAFDGLDKDAPAAPAIEKFHKGLLGTYADIRSAASKRRKKQQEAYNALPPNNE